MAEENKDENNTDNQGNTKTEAQYSEEKDTKTPEASREADSKASESTSDDTKTDDQEKAEKAVKDAEKAGATEEELERTRKALAKANKEAQERRYKLQEWDDLGVDPETVKQWKEERRNEEIRKAEEEGRYQDIIERTRQESQEIQEKSQAQVAQMKAQLEKHLVDKNLTEAIAAEEGIPKLLQGIARNYVKTVHDEASGEYHTKVVDDDGMPRVNDKGEEMSIRELVQSFKEDPELQYAFKAPKTSGSGNDSQASAQPPSKKPGPKPKKGDMSQKEQREFVQRYGYAEFAKLPR